MIRWFKTRRALLADLAERDETIRRADAKHAAEIDEVWNSTTSEVGSLNDLVWKWRDDYKRVSKELIAKRAQLAEVREELEKLRDDIARMERQQTVGIHPNLRAGTGNGMARPAPAHRDSLADFIAEDAKDVRLADGAGDPE